MIDKQDTTKQVKANKDSEPEYAIALSREDINAMPMDRYRGPVSVVRGEDETAKACRALSREKVLGFDTETRPAFRKGESYNPSLIQLAGAEKVYLFPLINNHIPASLKGLLQDASVLKAGVALEYDLKQLKAMDDFESGGFVSLEPMARAARIKNQGLRGLAAALLGFRISKRAQCSNWSRSDLTDTQIIYAATDAWVSRELYLHLKARLAQQKEESASKEIAVPS